MIRHAVAALGLAALVAAAPAAAVAPDAPVSAVRNPGPDDLARIEALLSTAGVTGLALGVVRGGQVTAVHAFGRADADTGRPLAPDAVMEAASLTKAVFAHLVVQLADEGRLDLDAPLPTLLGPPPSDVPWAHDPQWRDLADDDRWRRLTPRLLLSHAGGLPNWRWIRDDRRLVFAFEPGTRYVYSGEGLQLLQTVVEVVTGEPLAALLQRRVFDRFGMVDTRMTSDPAQLARRARPHDATGRALPLRTRRQARAAGSMSTTAGDYARFLAGVLRGDGLSPAAQAAMLDPRMAIVSPTQFPSHAPGETDVNRSIGLAAGLGWLGWRSTHGAGIFKEGHDDGTQNLAVGFRGPLDGVVMLSNSDNAEPVYLSLLDDLLLTGPSCLPWFWMGYLPRDRPELRTRAARDAPPGPGPGCGGTAGSRRAP